MSLNSGRTTKVILDFLPLNADWRTASVAHPFPTSINKCLSFVFYTRKLSKRRGIPVNKTDHIDVWLHECLMS